MKSASTSKLPKSVARSAMHEIGLAIVRGEYPPGSILPNEEALAARAGVSRPALREAIKVLSGKGLVRTARRYGSRVCARAEWNMLDPEVLAWHLANPANWPDFLRDTVEMRQLLEPTTAVLAATRATDEEIAQLRVLAGRIPPVMTEDSIADDVAFHTTIMRASHNGIMAGLAPSMEVLLRAYFAAVWRIRPHGPRRKGERNRHVELAAAIAARDPAAARAVMDDMLMLNAREIDELVELCRASLSAEPGTARPSGISSSLGERLRAASAQFLPV